VKVISSATDVNNDIFEKAVQGLVQRCLPQGILEELGLHVIEKHMTNEHASDSNIDKAKEIFQAEISRQLVWMLAAHLNTPFLLEAGVQSVVAASAHLHGDSVGRDVLGGIISSLVRLRKRLPDDSTKRLADGDPFQGVARSENLTDPGITSDREQTASNPKTNRKKKAKQRERSKDRELSSTRGDASIPDALNDPDVTTTKHTGKPDKDGKVSSTWRWAVDSVNISSDAVSGAFLRTADLFAYHALPLAKKKLGSSAKRKELRYEIQSMLEKTPAKEYNKWVRCFEMLTGGDMDMLVLPEPEPVSQNSRMAHVTPAPAEFQWRTKADIPNTSDNRSIHGEEDHSISQTRSTMVKHESIENDDIRPPIESTEGVPNNQPQESVADTPIVDLLWGKDTFDMENASNVRQTIMNTLDKRVSEEVSQRIMSMGKH
jgi:hypothetical protein